MSFSLSWHQWLDPNLNLKLMKLSGSTTVHHFWPILQLLFPHYFIPNTSGKIRTLNLRIDNSSVLPLCCFWEILQLLYCHFLSPGTRFRIQTLNLNIMSQVFYNCATAAGHLFSYFNAILPLPVPGDDKMINSSVLPPCYHC